MSHSRLLVLSSLLLYFSTGWSAAGRGRMGWSVDPAPCGGTRRVTPGQPVVVTSPGYPADHARRQRCSWRVQPSNPRDAIKLVCTDVDLAGFRLGLRVGDFLRVRTSGRSRLIQYRDMLHCADVPLKIQGKPGEPIHLRFSSDGIFQRRGFSCQASVPPGSTSPRSQPRECGVAFVSETAGNLTRSTTPPINISHASPTQTDVETSPSKPAILICDSSSRLTPSSNGPTPPLTVPTPVIPPSAQLFTWYEVTGSLPTTGNPFLEKASHLSDGTPASFTATTQLSNLSPVPARLILRRRSGDQSVLIHDHTPGSQDHRVHLRQRGRAARHEQEPAEQTRFPPREADLRVAGGYEVSPHAYPWAAFLVLTVQGRSGYICGATVISRRYLLTAAHCVYRADSATALLGYHSLKEPGPQSVQVPAEEAVVHPGWSARFVKHDIALLRLKRPVEYSVAVRPICLPTREQVSETFAGERATVLGWGGTGGGRGSEGRLRAAQVPLLANCRCQVAFPAVMTPLKLCAGGRQGTSACGGDSGGALQVTSGGRGQGHAVLVGVVSWGSAFGCDRGRPSGYTRITPYLDWIEQQSDVAIEPF